MGLAAQCSMLKGIISSLCVSKGKQPMGKRRTRQVQTLDDAQLLLRHVDLVAGPLVHLCQS